jgi:RNA polymerase sigma-70 factor (ECF subfamily)
MTPSLSESGGLVRLTCMTREKTRAALREEGDVEAALAGGDKRQTLTVLMDRFGDGVYRFAMAMTRDHNLAEEIRQQVFVEAYRDLRDFETGASLQGWLFGIARNRCIDAVKARARWNERYKNEAVDVPQHDCEVDRQLDLGRLARILAGCLGKLAPAAREAVLMRYQQELSYDEVAAIVGDLPGTVQRRVARALPVLRRCLQATLDPGDSR